MLDISLNLVEAQATLLFLIKMIIPKVFSLPLISLGNINCWLSSIPAPVLDKTGFPVGGGETTIDLLETAIVLKKLFLNITCVHWSRVDMDRRDILEHRVYCCDGHTFLSVLSHGDVLPESDADDRVTLSSSSKCQGQFWLTFRQTI